MELNHCQPIELTVIYKLQEEDKQRRAEAERIMVENQKKIEEQQRKMVSTKSIVHLLTYLFWTFAICNLINFSQIIAVPYL